MSPSDNGGNPVDTYSCFFCLISCKIAISNHPRKSIHQVIHCRNLTTYDSLEASHLPTPLAHRFVLLICLTVYADLKNMSNTFLEKLLEMPLKILLKMLLRNFLKSKCCCCVKTPLLILNFVKNRGLMKKINWRSEIFYE